MDKRTVGCLGGGQLGRMMVYAAHRLGVRMCILDPLGEQSPAGQVSELSIKGALVQWRSARLKTGPKR